MARTPQDVTEAELSLLRHLWDEGPATIRQLTDALYPGGGTTHYATVQKLLDRLESKGQVSRSRNGNVNVFTAKSKRDDLIGRRLQAIAETLCDGSLTPILTHLVKKQPMSAADRQSLRELIERLDARPRPKNNR